MSLSSDDERQHYHQTHHQGSDDDEDVSNSYGFDTNPQNNNMQNGYYRYHNESSSSEEETDIKAKECNLSAQEEMLPGDFEPIESYQKKKPQPPGSNSIGFGRSTSNKHGYDREVDEDEDCNAQINCQQRVQRQKPEYDADDEDDAPPPEDPFVSSFEIVSEDQRGLIEEQNRFIAEHYDEKEQDKYLSRAAARQFQESRDDDFDVISFATNDASSLVEVNARNMNVDIHWRGGQRPGNGADHRAVAMAMSQHVRAHGAR